MGLVYSTLFFGLRLYGAIGAVQASHKLLCEEGGDEASAAAAVRLLKQWAVLAALGIWESLGDPLLSWLPFYATVKLALFLAVVAPGAHMAPWVFDRLLRPSAEEAWRRVEQRAQPLLVNSALAMEVLAAPEEDAQEVQQLLTVRKRQRAAAAAAAGGGSGAASGATSRAASRAASPWRPAGGAGAAGGEEEEEEAAGQQEWAGQEQRAEQALGRGAGDGGAGAAEGVRRRQRGAGI